ncbi:sphingosine-1-phosphate phosphatase 2 isoform X1 [Lepisosteus oculatus]|uniref:sphingosine-1-phosphate phosphatase 2 isoform X1 n=1 Tax=Lepisosteus oculatus TaxID=7918 RepID=UPI0035F52589
MIKTTRRLQDSGLVASFQNSCGLFAIDGGEPISRTDPYRYNKTNHNAAPENTGKDGLGSNSWRDRDLRHESTASENHDRNSNYTSQVNGYLVKNSRPKYVVKNYFLYYLFRVGAALGQEVFYISFLPCTHWNLDPFLCRRLVNMWAVVMYIGQVSKDVLKWPRPYSPPVVKLETRVDAEYGMPSTHAMAATSIFFTLLLSTKDRYQYPFELGLMAASLLSTLVCLSRLYTGMHTVLDVVCGALISAVLMTVTFPLWDTFDHLQLTSPLSPIVAVVLPFLLSYFYPRLDHYSTTRGDTTIILGAGAGCSVGYWANYQLGETYEPEGGFPIPIPAPTLDMAVYSFARFLVGILSLVITRQVVKSLSLRVLCFWLKVSTKDAEARQRVEIEVPSKFVTYFAIGFTNTVLVHKAFIFLGLF